MNRHSSGAPGRPGRTDDLSGATLGNYRVLRLLGQGGMGSVYLAEHALIGRKVALKVLAPEIADQPEVVSRFFVEARAVNEIRHPNIVEVTDLGSHGDQPFIVMEYLHGQTLEDRLARVTRLSEPATASIARQIASALDAAHERGLVHRDLKPANLMLTDHPDYPDYVKVLDFGIAKLMAPVTAVGHHTEIGTLLGTPAYMSPEQCLGDAQLDHHSDIYSLGVILFQVLTGRLPFDDSSVGRLIMAHVNEPPPRLETMGISIGMAAVVNRALAKKPSDRYRSMHELRDALHPFLAPAARALTPIVGLPIVAREPPPAIVTPVPTIAPARGWPVTPGPVRLTDDEMRARLGDTVRERLRSGDIDLPALPDIFGQCLALLRNPSFSFSDMAALLRRDARLQSHVIRRANSDGVVGRGVATTIEQALGRLGSIGLCAAVVELGAKRVIDLRDERLEEIYRRPWHHALAGAIVADRLARAQGLEALASDAYLAALLRDVGVPLLAPLVYQLHQGVVGPRSLWVLAPAVLVDVVEAHRRAAAGLLCERWDLAPAVARAVEGAGRFEAGTSWSVHNLAQAGAALADREGFYLRRELLPEAEQAVAQATRDFGLNDLRIRRAVERLKEAVRLRE